MEHFYTQQKRQTPINYQRPKKRKKTQLKLAWKKPKDRWIRKENAKKKKNETSGQNSIAYCWHNTHPHMRQMSFAGKIDHLADVVFGWQVNIACCCASIGTRILLTSLVDLVTGCVRTKWLTWNHCEAKEKKEKDTDLCQILWTDLFFFPFSFQRRRPNKQGV